MADNQNIETPPELIKQAGLKKGYMSSGGEVLVPNGVSDNFARRLSQGALQNTHNTNDFINLFNYFLQNVLETKASQRMARYDQMDFIVENDPALSMTRQVLTDEILQPDTYAQPLIVTAKNPRFKKAIEKFFSDIGFSSYLKEIASNVITYGDAFVIMDLTEEEGVTALIPVDPRSVKHRFEFSLAELAQSKNKIIKKYTAYQAIADLAQTIKTKAKEFSKVLLGFQVDNTLFPFWQVLHYRQFTTRNTLAPFGKPTFYESQSEARMYLNAKVVISMIRSSAFMREHIKVKTAEGEDPSSQFEKVQEVKQQMEMFLSTSSRSAKDYPSFGERLYYPEDLMTIDKVEAGYNFRDKFDDLQMMREDVFTSTGLPKEYFVGGEGRQYVSERSLISQDKKAARKVFGLQNVIIDQAIKAVEVHFSHTGEFDPFTEQFAVSMPYPVPDMEDSVLQVNNSKIQYAETLIGALKNTLEVTKLPTSTVKHVLTKYFSMNDKEIRAIMTQLQSDTEEEEEIGFSRLGARAGDPYLHTKIQGDQAIQTAHATADDQDKMMDIQTKTGKVGLDMQKLQLKQMKDQMKAAKEQEAQAAEMQAQGLDPATGQPMQQADPAAAQQADPAAAGAEGQQAAPQVDPSVGQPAGAPPEAPQAPEAGQPVAPQTPDQFQAIPTEQPQAPEPSEEEVAMLQQALESGKINQEGIQRAVELKVITPEEAEELIQQLEGEMEMLQQALESGKINPDGIQRALELGLIAEEQAKVLIDQISAGKQGVPEHLVTFSRQYFIEGKNYNEKQYSMMLKQYQKWLNESHNSKLNESLEVLHKKKTSIDDVVEGLLFEQFAELGDEFVFADKHFVTNNHKSPDRNLKFVLDETKVKKELVEKLYNNPKGKVSPASLSVSEVLQEERTQEEIEGLKHRSQKRSEWLVEADQVIDRRYSSWKTTSTGHKVL